MKNNHKFIINTKIVTRIGTKNYCIKYFKSTHKAFFKRFELHLNFNVYGF